MSHGLSGLSTYGLNGHRKEDDKHSMYAPVGYSIFTFTYLPQTVTNKLCYVKMVN